MRRNREIGTEEEYQLDDKLYTEVVEWRLCFDSIFATGHATSRCSLFVGGLSERYEPRRIRDVSSEARTSAKGGHHNNLPRTASRIVDNKLLVASFKTHNLNLSFVIVRYRWS